MCISVLRKFEDTKGVMRRGNTKKDKQCNGQKKKRPKGKHLFVKHYTEN